MTEIHWPDIRILIAEDEEDLRDLLVAVFKSRGCQVFSAQNGHEAIDIFKENQIDVILSDVRMPHCDGYELLAEIQDCPEQDLLFYLMTGYADISTAEALQRGANRLIHKPFSIDELCLLLEAQLLRKK